MAVWLNKAMVAGPREIAFVCGGAYGFSEDMYKLAHYLIALSKLTFTHQMVRLIFLEQLYRCPLASSASRSLIFSSRSSSSSASAFS